MGNEQSSPDGKMGLGTFPTLESKPFLLSAKSVPHMSQAAWGLLLHLMDILTTYLPQRSQESPVDWRSVPEGPRMPDVAEDKMIYRVVPAGLLFLDTANKTRFLVLGRSGVGYRGGDRAGGVDSHPALLPGSRWSAQS